MLLYGLGLDDVWLFLVVVLFVVEAPPQSHLLLPQLLHLRLLLLLLLLHYLRLLLHTLDTLPLPLPVQVQQQLLEESYCFYLGQDFLRTLFCFGSKTTPQGTGQFHKLFLCFQQGSKGLDSSRLVDIFTNEFCLKLRGTHILHPLYQSEMMLVSIHMLLWILLDRLLTAQCSLRFLLLGLRGNDLISLLLPIIEPHFLLRHITILKSIPSILPYIYSLIHREQTLLPANNTYIPYLLHHMNNNMARRTSRSDNPEPKRKKEAAIELTSDQSREFAEEEVVWAKVVGHPWWPAVISEKSYPTYQLDNAGTQLKRKEVTYRVSFFGEASHAFLQESKIAEYIPNRDYFVQLALKQSKRCNIDAFRASVKQADITSNNPFEVGEVPAALLTPKKERPLLKEERTAAYREQSQVVEVKQNSTLKPIKINIHTQKPLSLPFRPTNQQIKISQYALRLLKDKNKSNYTISTLKCAVIHALKRQKYLKKLNKLQSSLTLQWLRKLSLMDIDEFVHANCKRSQITHQSSIPTVPPEQKRTPKKNPSPPVSLSYIYLDELGNKITSTVPLEPFDFYIQL